MSENKSENPTTEELRQVMIDITTGAIRAVDRESLIDGVTSVVGGLTAREIAEASQIPMDRAEEIARIARLVEQLA